MSIMIVLVLIGILATVGIVLLQFFLSKKSNKWYGLVLPLIFFAFSLQHTLTVMDTGSLWQNVISSASIFLLSNIPTVILLVTYFACRENLKRATQTKKTL